MMSDFLRNSLKKLFVSILKLSQIFINCIALIIIFKEQHL